MNNSRIINDQGLIALINQLPIACILTSIRDSRVLAVNPAFEQLLGWSGERLVNSALDRLPIWFSAEQRTAFFDDLARMGSLKQSEARFQCRDGGIKPCLVYVEQIMVDGETCRLGLIHDISDRIHVEEALKRSETKFTSLFMDSPEPYILFSQNTAQITEINRRFTEVFGYTQEDVIGKTAVEVGLWRYPEKRPEVIGRLVRERFLRNEPVDFITRDGRILNCEVSSNFILVGLERCTLSCFKDVTEQVNIQGRIKHQAYHDALTDLPNRLLLADRLQQHLALGERHGLTFAVLFLDLDHFKRINDSLGHGLGDAVLREVSRRLRAGVPKADTVARLGGDEFVILLTGLTGDGEQIANNTRLHAQKLLDALSEPMYVEGHSLQLNCSIGIALAGEHGSTPEDMLKHADTALHGVKASGRNGIAFFEPQMQVDVSQRLQLEADLRQALKSGAFRLHYQPQIDARENRILGVEALVRWQHPQKGLIGPATFIHVLEESGMILDVGYWVLDEACGFVARLLQQKLIDAEQFSLSINISPRQFRQADFVSRVAAAIEARQIPTQCLQLEITESVVIHDLNDTVEKMHQLRKMGICFAIDDFGTGYSSLSYLKRLPVDQLKIDQSFVRDCTVDSHDAEIIRAIIAMGRSLNMELIAEGVETAEQLAFLQQQDCHAYQGYLFSPAVSEEQLCMLIQQHPYPGS
ncbi:MAG: EAL domain-containing protein [Pseudomonas sp.]